MIRFRPASIFAFTVTASVALLSARPSSAADADAASANDDDVTPTPAATPRADGDAAAAPATADTAGTSFSHLGQLGVRAGLVAGYRMILRYESSPYCAAPDANASEQQKFCGHGAPLAGDFGVSFGVLDFLEPFAWARFGFAAETATDTKPLVVLGVGTRIYTMSDAAFKVFIEPAVGFELEGGRGTPAWQTNHPDYKKDLMFHLAAGPQFDFARNVGAYVAAGISADVLRSLGSSLDLNFGVQGRVP